MISNIFANLKHKRHGDDVYPPQCDPKNNVKHKKCVKKKIISPSKIYQHPNKPSRCSIFMRISPNKRFIVRSIFVQWMKFIITEKVSRSIIERKIYSKKRERETLVCSKESTHSCSALPSVEIFTTQHRNEI